jgi:deazaflavin-dependent oxidoreductase (nitroreductase family)
LQRPDARLGAAAATTEEQLMPDTTHRYVIPTSTSGRVLLRLSNSVMAGLARLGLSVKGSRVLWVRGRTSGEWRTTPVNPLRYQGDTYLVAPRGRTQWVRNMRAAGGGELHLGRKVERFTATELADADKPELLRAYLKAWKSEVGIFFDGVGPDASDEQLLAIAPGYPVFKVSPA